ncbi:MAG: hypothetical protein FJW38_06915 [Acidobacteria bacterium]|nr:hypothetical protein [Acidobacteriota bacterium]
MHVSGDAFVIVSKDTSARVNPSSNSFIFFIPAGILTFTAAYFFFSRLTLGGCIILAFAGVFFALGMAIRRKERVTK